MNLDPDGTAYWRKLPRCRACRHKLVHRDSEQQFLPAPNWVIFSGRFRPLLPVRRWRKSWTRLQRQVILPFSLMIPRPPPPPLPGPPAVTVPASTSVR